MRRTALVVLNLGSFLMLALPEASLGQTKLALNAPLASDPYRMSVRSGGNVPIAEMDLDSDDDCDYGYVDPAAVVNLEYRAGTDFPDLHIYAESDRDIMLIVEDPLGVIYCDDDSHEGLNPVIHVPVPFDGPYTIAVGTYSSSSIESATLFFSHTDPTGGSTVADGSSSGRPDLSADPTYGRVSLGAPFNPDPHTVSVSAGGSVDVDITGCTYGYVARAPDYNVTYSGSGTTLYFFVRADEDTTLLINRPDASWVCDDDSLGDSNPVVTIPNASSGLYNVWVGTYSSDGDLVPSTLYISTKAAK
jgi:hypothetical protein